jgi:hypothetical protein
MFPKACRTVIVSPCLSILALVSRRKARPSSVLAVGVSNRDFSSCTNDSFRLALRAADQGLDVIPELRCWLS